MNPTKVFSNILLWFYKKTNQSGLMDSPWFQIFYTKCYFTYKKYMEDACASLTKNYPELFQTGHVLDIGANIGYTASVFAKALNTNFKVFAFEPENRNFKMLNQASEAYGFSNKLLAVRTAVGEHHEETNLWQNPSHNGDHRIATDFLQKQLTSKHTLQKTTLLSIDEYFKEQTTPICFTKIDVQGYELAVCKGMQHTLTLNPNMIIYIEYCPSSMQALGFNAEDLLLFFQARNYQFYHMNKKTLMPLIINSHAFVKAIKKKGYIDILCSKRSLL